MKNILLYRNRNQAHNSLHLVPTEGRFAIVTIRRAQDAMDAAASGMLACRTKTLAAYGEVVWSWRRDRGVKPRGKSRAATVATNAAHRGEHV